ncbi:MAG: WG repeat-containing protein [Planctomycetota bacterium]|nr:WG repeat-containing protein [Planctomycetota bacterium]
MNEPAWGYANTEGVTVLPAKYDLALPFSEGLGVVSDAGEYFYIDRSGKTIIRDGFDDAGPFSCGLAVVSREERFGMIDKEGRFVIPAGYDDLTPCHSGIAVYTVDGVRGYISDLGKVMIPPTFERASPFSEGLAAVMEHGAFYYINALGERIFGPFCHAYSFQCGCAIIVDNGQRMVLDHFGSKSYNGYSMSSASNGMIQITSNDDLHGFMRTDGSVVVEPVFEAASGYSGGLAAVKRNGKWGAIDVCGTTVVGATFDTLGDFCRGFAFGRIGKQTCQVSVGGRIVVPKDSEFQFSNDPIGEDLFVVCSERM